MNIDLNHIEVVGKPSYSIISKIIMSICVIVFAASLLFLLFQASYCSDVTIITIFISAIISCVICVLIGFLSARCIFCQKRLVPFGFNADLKDALEVKTTAKRSGFEIKLPKNINGESAERIGFDCFRCEECNVIYIASIADLTGDHGT
jgi:hypothetical protein